jgi:DnaJ-domain-containing protein 1
MDRLVSRMPSSRKTGLYLFIDGRPVVRVQPRLTSEGEAKGELIGMGLNFLFAGPEAVAQGIANRRASGEQELADRTEAEINEVKGLHDRLLRAVRTAATPPPSGEPRGANTSPPPTAVPPPKPDPYQTLGVTRSATADQLKQAYRRRIQESHPDKVATMSARLRRAAEEEAQEVNAAWDVIKKERKIA